ncbi:serine hydrolase domain-containing protein [Gluconobacter sphaericus]|uniref:serine hydrolase domain-containing protein n=1 Tax=Gluconobacter sphaericus TaxID=574987 RepID=UPI001B8CA530|nr:serine hydrolase domain-containing protein [Gluconobacter sphaericus]MBS1086017.1 beta-lactamase family protein [Gluconobacter sphaericus]MBS1101243.1 beta-lactamase family protein [Gluconobacter sphaericus]
MPENFAFQGSTSERFEAVKQEFACLIANEGNDFAAQFVVYHQGECVVDLWAGAGVNGDSLCGVYSACKGAAHLVVALLVQDGILNLDERVSHYWPEFSANGKSDISLRELMAHRAGLAGPDRGLSLDELSDDRAVAQRIGQQRPYWRPGTAFGYHALVIAALTGEVVFRATGWTIQEHFAFRIRTARDVDFFLGLPKEEEHRFLEAQLPLITPEHSTRTSGHAVGSTDLSDIAFNRHHPENPAVWELPNFRIVRERGPASFGGVASARALARMYASAISPMDNLEPLLRPEITTQFSQIHSIGYDLVTRNHRAFGAGFHLPSEYYPAVAQGAFGHSGAGGQQAFADPRNEIAYAYSRRRPPVPFAAAPENDRLIRAVYAAIAK